jgi:hypothetical protein
VANHQDTKTPRFGSGFVPWSLGGKNMEKELIMEIKRHYVFDKLFEW